MKRMACLLMILMLLLTSVSLAEQTWKCTGCGRSNSASFSFCPSCGARLKSGTSAASTKDV